MQTSFECYSCFMDQAVRASRMVTNDEVLIKEVVDRVGESFRKNRMCQNPPEMGAFIYSTVRELTGVEDPYLQLKKESIRQVKVIYPAMQKLVEQSDDPLLTAIRLATIGNVLDPGVSRQYDLMEEIEKLDQMEYAIFHYDAFRYRLEQSNHVLFIGDNCGESVFDSLLIEILGVPVTYVVREAPIINDVTRQDALDSGIGEVADIISSGSTAPGTILNMCNDDFLARFEEADMVISKGQGNFEGLSDVERQVFFLLRAKCPVVAGHLGLKLNDFVLAEYFQDSTDITH